MRKRFSDEPEFVEIVRHYESTSDTQLALEDDAAARMALAAPELLNACKAALLAIAPRSRTPRLDARSTDRIARTLRSAIAKAEGRRAATRRKSG